MDFRVVSIKRPSARVLGKMRKGKSCRICRGEGMQIVVHPHRFNHITRAFDKDKAHTLELSPEEVNANRMAGSGLFDDIRGGFEKVGRAIEPVAKEAAGQALDYLAEQAPNIGASALSGLALYAGQPELVPIAQAVGRQGGQALGQLARKEGRKALGNYNEPETESIAPPTPRQRRRRYREYDPSEEEMIEQLPMPPRRNAPPSRSTATNALSAKTLKDYSEDELGQEIAQRRGGYGTPFDSSGGKRVLSPYVSAVGQGLGSGMKEKGSVAVHGNLIRGSGVPPALMSQPYASNFQMAARLPPQYAQLIKS